MNLTGEYQLAAPREVVWRALNDPEILRQSIPGCESVEKLSDTELTAKVTLQIGPMKAKFSGKVTLSDLDPPNGYTISGEGQGGVAGFGKGKSSVKLEAVDGGAATVLRYAAEAQVGGKIAQLGARLIDATAKKLADQFFGNFAALINAPQPQAGTEPQPNAAAAATPVAASPIAPGSSDTAAPPVVPPAPAASGGAGAPLTPPASDGRLKPVVWIPILVAVVAFLLWWFAGG